MIMLQTPAEGERLHLRIRKQIISLTFGVVSADSFGLVESSRSSSTKTARSIDHTQLIVSFVSFLNVEIIQSNTNKLCRCLKTWTH